MNTGMLEKCALHGRIQFQLYRADGERCTWRCVGEWFVDGNVVNRVPHSGGGVMVWPGISSMACILTRHVTHWACLDSMFQFPPKSSNFAQPLKRSGTTFHRPRSTAWLTLCEGDVLRCMRQMVVTPDTDWFSDPHPYLFWGGYLWPTDLYSQSCQIYRLGPNEFISIDWFPYMNCNCKIFEIVAYYV
jgi:hypothetical protein